MKFTIRHGVANAGDSGHSRAGVFPLPTGAVIAVADGTGEPAAAGKAAETALEFAKELADQQALRANYEVFQQHLAKMDAAIAADPDASETSLFVAAVSERGIAGYSVGTCRAWFISEHGAVELTERQVAEPLAGSGKAGLVPFAIQSAVGHVLVCSEGLWRHADQEQMLAIARGEDLSAATKSLLALPRLPSGGLHTDVAVILCQLESGE